MIELRSGTIILDGRDISRVGVDVLRRQLAIIPQDPVLFSGTIRCGTKCGIQWGQVGVHARVGLRGSAPPSGHHPPGPGALQRHRQVWNEVWNAGGVSRREVRGFALPAGHRPTLVPWVSLHQRRDHVQEGGGRAGRASSSDA